MYSECDYPVLALPSLLHPSIIIKAVLPWAIGAF
jgi:hypothetical protein